jgi:hypothetical protein
MNAFRQCVQDLGLTFESQGTGYENSWLFVLLSMMADTQDANPVDPTFPNNPVKQVLHQLQSYLDTFAGQRLSQIIDKLQYRYA